MLKSYLNVAAIDTKACYLNSDKYSLNWIESGQRRRRARDMYSIYI